jgi:hypothetical protein
MDAVQQFAKTIGVITPQKFLVAGVAEVNKLSNLFFD